MERKIIITKDGSHSIAIPEMNVTYHSVHGAIKESMHVFIEAGLYGSGRSERPDPFKRVRPLVETFQKGDTSGTARRVVEMGFGTGLNALLTLIEANTQQLPIHYTAIELYPLSHDDIKLLNYCEQLNQLSYQPLFEELHTCEWEKDIPITPYFTFHKTRSDLLEYSTNHVFDLVYFDAFAPPAQPGLWTKEIFEKLYNLMSAGGILVTYCSKGDVRRAMQAAGFTVEKLAGPPGKREMIRACKNRFTG